MLRVSTFGGLRIERDGQLLQLPTQKAAELVAYLLSFRDRAHPRSVLAGLLWPDLPEDKARHSLSDTLWRVRRVLGDHVATDEDSLWFNAALPYRLDAEAFEHAVRSGQGTAEALDLYHGPFLDGFYSDWVLLEQERLRGLYLQLLEELLARCKQSGDFYAAVDIGQRLVAAEPLHEAAHRELMRLYHLLGRDPEAIAQYQRCRQILQAELGVPPAAETEGLYQALAGRIILEIEAPVVHLPAPVRRPILDLHEPPFVGHEAERAALLGCVEAAACGQGGIVLLEGEPGIGKSRLAREIAAGARWRSIGATLVAAEAEVTAPYTLLLAALKPVLTPLRLRQLSGLVEPVHFQAAVQLLPHIAQSLPAIPAPPDLPPLQARERLQQALVALILGLARIAPHLWVLEDLQWADAETLALLPVLYPQVPGHRLLLLLTGRSADLRASAAVWQTLQVLDRAGPLPRYVLGRLSPADVGSLLRDLLGEENPELSAHLAQQSEGVPLYVVETLKSWRDEGCLRPTERGTWCWQGGSPDELPSRVGERVIDHRIARLSPPAWNGLVTAAVIGTDVDYDLLARASAPSGAPPDAAAAHLDLLASTDELLRLGLLVETDAGYRFSHEQVRHAVYSQMPPTRRRRLHQRVARALTELSPTKFDSLAHHFAAAGEAQRALDYLGQAARQARELYAHETALSCYDRMLELLPRPKDRAARYDVLQDRAEVRGWVGDREAQGRDLGEMLLLARELPENARLAAALYRRSEWHRLQGHYPQAEEDALAALSIYRELGDDRARADLLGQLGWSLVYTAGAPRVAGYFQEALATYRDLDDLEGQINCLSGLCALAELEGDYFQALAYLRENLALAEASGNPLRIGRALHNTGVVYYDLGDLDAASGYLQQALQVKESIGDRRSQALTHFYLGVVTAELGHPHDAQRWLEAAWETFSAVHDAAWEGDTLAALGRLALAQGRAGPARRHLEAAYQRRCQLGEPGYAVIDLSYLALAELGLGNEAAAWRHSREAVGQLEQGLERVETPQQIYYNHFRIAQSVRRWAAARAALERAAEIVAERAGRIGDPALRDIYRTRHRLNRDISAACALLPPPGWLRVRLARAGVPAHRRPASEETVAVTWTVDAGETDAVAGRQGAGALRRQRLQRLLAEAAAAGAEPTVADLAGALDVSSRTIRADLGTLRRQGHAVPTRGRQD
jgi:DNA-binding SARP family transcriptional activator